jgi:ureidoglycolate dehydrogenase (NAD+)
LLETYVMELQGGRCKANPQFKFSDTLPAAGLLDADDALGVVAGNEAMKLALSRAGTYGISAIAVSNSNHCGAAEYYATLGAEAGMIGLAFANSDALVAPFNGAVALNGTNPIGMAAPGVGDEMFSLDMSTSQISFLRALHAQTARQADKSEEHPARRLLQKKTIRTAATAGRI